MNFEAGIRFIVFLVIFGVTNYLMMLRRYENDIKKRNFYNRKKFPGYTLKVHLFSNIKKFFFTRMDQIEIVFDQIRSDFAQIRSD